MEIWQSQIERTGIRYKLDRSGGHIYRGKALVFVNVERLSFRALKEHIFLQPYLWERTDSRTAAGA